MDYSIEKFVKIDENIPFFGIFVSRLAQWGLDQDHWLMIFKLIIFKKLLVHFPISHIKAVLDGGASFESSCSFLRYMYTKQFAIEFPWIPMENFLSSWDYEPCLRDSV